MMRSTYNKPQKPSDSLIELSKKFVVDTQVEILHWISCERWNPYRGEENELKEFERKLRFDEQEQEFYIHYDGGKYYVKPYPYTPANEEDISLYQWTTLK